MGTAKASIWFAALGLLLLAVGAYPQTTNVPQASAEPYDQDADGESRAKQATAGLIGSAAPVMRLKTIDGDPIDLLSLYGQQPVYFKFWATWCVPCRKQMPGFESIYQRYGEAIKTIAVNTGFNDSEEAIRRYRKKIPMSMPIVIDDGTLAAHFNLQVTPMHVIVARDGRIAYVGHMDGERLDAAINAAIAQAPEAYSSTNPATAAVHFTVGDTVTDLQITTLAGKKVSLATSNKPRALMFFAPWCESYLTDTRPAMAQDCARFRKQAEALQQHSEFDWYGISSNLWVNRDEVKAYQQDTATQIPLVYDANGELFRAFLVRDVPSIVLLDKTARVKKIIDHNTQDIAAAMAQGIK